MRPTPHPRASGTDYAFGRADAYPRFWLKRAVISSQPDAAGFAGEVSGELLDFTTEPAVLGRPSVARLKGDFPAHGVRAASAELLIDRSGEVPRERLLAAVGAYPVAGRALVSGDALTLGLERAVAGARVELDLNGDQVALSLQSAFTDVDYRIAARSPLVQQVVQRAVADIDPVELSARVSGTWEALRWQLDSNLGARLAAGFQRQLQAGVDAARARAEALVRERIAGERVALETQFAAAERQIKTQLAAYQGELNKAQAELDRHKRALEERQRVLVKAQEDKLKKEAGKLLDGLKIKR